jgi:hypothetical protein
MGSEKQIVDLSLQFFQTLPRAEPQSAPRLTQLGLFSLLQGTANLSRNSRMSGSISARLVLGLETGASKKFSCIIAKSDKARLASEIPGSGSQLEMRPPFSAAGGYPHQVAVKGSWHTGRNRSPRELPDPHHPP